MLTIYGRCGHPGNVTWTIFPLNHGNSRFTLVLIVQPASEKRIFENSINIHVHGPGQGQTSPMSQTCFYKHEKELYGRPRDYHNKMSRVVRKPAFCICENKDADQLRGSREADQRLRFRYIETTIPLLSMYEISSL